MKVVANLLKNEDYTTITTGYLTKLENSAEKERASDFEEIKRKESKYCHSKSWETLQEKDANDFINVAKTIDVADSETYPLHLERTVAIDILCSV